MEDRQLSWHDWFGPYIEHLHERAEAAGTATADIAVLFALWCLLCEGDGWIPDDLTDFFERTDYPEDATRRIRQQFFTQCSKCGAWCLPSANHLFREGGAMWAGVPATEASA